MRVIAFTLFLSLVAAQDETPAATEIVHENGGYCGVQSSDFVQYSFAGDFRVAGEQGCDLNENDKDCFCAPDLTDNQRLSGWKWQCGGTAPFGPSPGKTCPLQVPYQAPDVTAQALGVPEVVPCDLELNPTGYPQDPVCGYSTCEEGGTTSAVCACVDLSARGLGDGPQWFCLHSTCSCSDEENEKNSIKVEASGAMGAGSFVTVAAAVVAAFYI